MLLVTARRFVSYRLLSTSNTSSLPSNSTSAIIYDQWDEPVVLSPPINIQCPIIFQILKDRLNSSELLMEEGLKLVISILRVGPLGCLKLQAWVLMYGFQDVLQLVLHCSSHSDMSVVNQWSMEEMWTICKKGWIIFSISILPKYQLTRCWWTRLKLKREKSLKVCSVH